MTATLVLPATEAVCQDCGHDHRGCECGCVCPAQRRLPADRHGRYAVWLVCDRPPHDDPPHHDIADGIWWLTDQEALDG